MVCPRSRSLFRFIINKIFSPFLTLFLIHWGGSGYSQNLSVVLNADALEATVVTPWKDGVLVGGTFRGTWDGTAALGTNDAWLRQYDSTLNVQWHYVLQSPAAVQLTALTSNAQGWYWAGNFSDSLFFDYGDTVLYAARPTALIAHHQPNGRLDWVYTLPASGVVQLHALGVDQQGTLYATGSFQDSLYLSGQAPLYSNARQAPLLLKLLPNGQLDWVQTSPLCLDAQGTALTLDTNGNLYWSAQFNGHFAWPTLPDTFQAHWVYHDILIQKVTPQGSTLWYQHGNGPYDNVCTNLSYHEGQLCVVGRFKGRLDWREWRFENAYQQHYASYLLALDPQTGVARWGRQARAIADNSVEALALGPIGVALCGTFRDSLDWRGIPCLAQAGTEAYLLQLDSNGQIRSMSTGRGSGFDLAQALTYSSDGALWTVGTFQDSLRWDDGLLLTGTGFSSAYIWRSSPLHNGHTITPVQSLPFTLVAVQLQPHPAYDTVRIVLEASNALLGWQLYDLQGQLVQQGRDPFIQVVDLPKGTYSLRIDSDAGLGVEKLVVP